MKHYTVQFTPGEDFNQTFRLSDGDGVVINLTGAEAELVLKREGTAVFSFLMSPTVDDGTVTIAEEDGEIRLYAAYDLVETALAQACEGALFVTWADDTKQALFCLVVQPHTCDGI